MMTPARPPFSVLSVPILAAVAITCVGCGPWSAAEDSPISPGPAESGNEPTKSAAALTGDSATVASRATLSDTWTWNAWEPIPLAVRKGMGPGQRALLDGLNEQAELVRAAHRDAVSELDRRARVQELAQRQTEYLQEINQRLKLGFDHWAFRYNESDLQLEFGQGWWGDGKSHPLVTVSLKNPALLTSELGPTLRTLKDGEWVYLVSLEVPQLDPFHTAPSGGFFPYRSQHDHDVLATNGYALLLPKEGLILLKEPDFSVRARLVQERIAELREQACESIQGLGQSYSTADQSTRKSLAADLLAGQTPEPSYAAAQWSWFKAIQEIQKFDPNWKVRQLLDDPRVAHALAKPLADASGKSAVYAEKLKQPKLAAYGVEYDVLANRYIALEGSLQRARKTMHDYQDGSTTWKQYRDLLKFAEEAEASGKLVILETKD